MKHRTIRKMPEIRLPRSTRGIQVHSSLKDYDRAKERKEINKKLEESE